MSRNCSPAGVVSVALLCGVLGAAAEGCGGTDDSTSPQVDDGGSHDTGVRKDAGRDSSIVRDTGSDSSEAPETGDDGGSSGDDSGDSGDATFDGSPGADAAEGSAADGPATTDAPGDGSNADATDASPDTSSTDAPVDGPSDGPAEAEAGLKDVATSDGSTCDFNGTWGSRFTIDASWTPSGATAFILAPGSGTLKQWLLNTRVQTGNTFTDTATVCGLALPDFMSTALAGNGTVGETYGIRFPDSLFDNGYLPSFTINGSVTSSAPGASYTTQTSAALVGLTLANATTATWPSTITTAVDQDMDGKPGVTANLASGTGYSNVPVDIFKTRADRLYVALRQVNSTTATFSDCDHASGTVNVPQLPSGSGNYAMNVHVVGCHLVSGSDCTTSEAQFVDQNSPVFTPTGATFTQVRLPAGATCATVRTQLQ